MPSQTLPAVDHFNPVAPTKEPIDFMSLHTVDLSTYGDGPAARQALAAQVSDAMTTQGFFTLINHGINEHDIERQVDIGHTVLKRTSQEDKERLRARIREDGDYIGFKPRGIWTVDTKTKDSIEQFNVHRHLDLHQQPPAFEPHRDEFQSFVDRTHKDVLYKLLRLFAIALELEDEDYLVKLHDYNGHDSSWFRYMEFYAEHEADKKGKPVWLQGHQDFVSLTILFSQPMTSLQVRDSDDNAEWKYVAHTPGAIIVNAGEIMQWFTGGHFKAAIHRVSEPPKDQRGHDRCGVFYFAVPNKDVVINTLLDQSPVLRAAGVRASHKPEDAPTSDEWCRGRVMVTGKGDKFKENAGASEVENVGKVVTTWFR